MVQDYTKQRTKNCEDLMRPEIRPLLDLSLEEKEEKSKEVIKETFEKFKNVGLGFSGGTDSLVLLHLMLQIKKDVPLIFVNTYHQFQESYDFLDQVEKEWDLKDLRRVKAPENRLEAMKERFGWKTPEFTEICCGYHKIAPMMDAIRKYKFDAFFVGLRGVEHEERAQETFFSPRKDPDHVRVHPLLFWTSQDILDYVKKHNVKVNPLYAKGYTSLGCSHCTDVNPDPNAHERAGRGHVREEIMKRLRDLGYT
ncbi:MAG: phosphoadenosine phosphosulfate reductase family protein [Nanoarchaeota archaeon]|nr:phosphoadenosine phosphosulfate reductase family protein [Nanoarchaeota archaeon]MBU1444879.1 phosphoadenosine phosphosulfate reductase family protein [Nanoarchaeota archaeon]MBU2420677.1 phosphoadenosine phosphosulfate reductase family protein [Nanoarchaeota archaeon]MBU2475509.1 phosphoadenosine phosphosulfate reductase family protein [Nanoarchaeota archaeon]